MFSVYRNRKLAVIEAKAWDEKVSLGVPQAKNYASKLALRFAYSSNGQGVYSLDMESGAEVIGELSFPTPDELWNLQFAKAKDNSFVRFDADDDDNDNDNDDADDDADDDD